MKRMLINQIESHCNYTGVKPVAVVSNSQIKGKYVIDFVFDDSAVHGSIRLKSQREGSRKFSSIAAIVKTCGSMVKRIEIKSNEKDSDHSV